MTVVNAVSLVKLNPVILTNPVVSKEKKGRFARESAVQVKFLA